MAEVQSASLRLLLEHINSPGEEASSSFDEALTLKGTSGLQDVTAKRRMRLPAAASDQALTFTNAAAVILWSHDNGFKVRLGAAETLTGLLRAFVLWAKDEATAAKSTSVLLTADGTNAVDLEIWIIEKTP